MQDLTPEERIYQVVLNKPGTYTFIRPVQKPFVDTPECSSKPNKTDREVLDYVAELTEANTDELAGLVVRQDTQEHHLANIKNEIHTLNVFIPKLLNELTLLRENEATRVVKLKWPDVIAIMVLGSMFIAICDAIILHFK